MEREMLRAARERKERGENDHTHIAIAIVLFMVAAVLYAVGYAGAAALVAVGFIVEMAAWVSLMNGNRPMPKVEVPPVSAALEKERNERT
jgi:protein-S-isoprenylcysteine O-methyltransferase Ste14